MSVQVSYYDGKLYSIYLGDKESVILTKILREVLCNSDILTDEDMEKLISKILEVNHE